MLHFAAYHHLKKKSEEPGPGFATIYITLTSSFGSLNLSFFKCQVRQLELNALVDPFSIL